MANKTDNTGKKKFSIKDYFRGIKIEMKKVVWPTKSELISYTGVVIGVCAVCALGFWAVDSVCALIIQNLLGVQLTM